MKHRKETITAVLFFLLLAMGLCYVLSSSSVRAHCARSWANFAGTRAMC